MGIKLSLDVETPLSADERDILAGISVMVLAIANRQDLVDQPHMRGLPGEPEPCGSEHEDGRICFSRPFPPVGPWQPLPSESRIGRHELVCLIDRQHDGYTVNVTSRIYKLGDVAQDQRVGHPLTRPQARELGDAERSQVRIDDLTGYRSLQCMVEVAIATSETTHAHDRVGDRGQGFGEECGLICRSLVKGQ